MVAEHTENIIPAWMVHNKPQPPRTETISLLKEQGVIALIFRCKKTTCSNTKTFPVTQFSDKETLGSLAVKAKCSRCGRLNCSISPKWGKKS